MLSNAQSKYIRSLTQQKYRKQYNVFVVEGDKLAREWLSDSRPIHIIVATADWVGANESLIITHREAELLIVTDDELEKLSGLQTPNKVLLVVPLAGHAPDLPNAGLCIAVENLQDPGNLGSIIRIADWFAIPNVIASPGSADFYNPKVIQAAMGGHLRVELHRAEITGFLHSFADPVYATALQGTSIYEIGKIKAGAIVIGNESKGLSDSILSLATEIITIPKMGGAESLNAAVSAGIIAAILVGR